MRGFCWAQSLSAQKWREIDLGAVRRCTIFLPSGIESPSGHQNWEWALKSPLKNDEKWFSALIFTYKFLKLDKKAWQLEELWSKASIQNSKKYFFLPNFYKNHYGFIKTQTFSDYNGKRIFIEEAYPTMSRVCKIVSSYKGVFIK